MLALLTLVLAQTLSAQAGTPTHGEWGDQGDGSEVARQGRVIMMERAKSLAYQLT